MLANEEVNANSFLVGSPQQTSGIKGNKGRGTQGRSATGKPKLSNAGTGPAEAYRPSVSLRRTTWGGGFERKGGGILPKGAAFDQKSFLRMSGRG